MKTICLTQGQVAQVDDSDYEAVSKLKWYFHSHKNKSYAFRNEIVNGKSRTVMMHRFILGLRFGDSREVDHRDNDGLNNQRDNIRICTHRQNMMNTSKVGHSSRYRGVCWSKQKRKWMSRVVSNGRQVHCGFYKSEFDAAIAYNRKASELFGEFARLNGE